jgi:hypothetical protein
MSADPPSFIADVAAQVVAWHNRHPLARRIARKDVQSVGIVELPFAREAQPPWHAMPPKRGLLALMFPKRVNLKPWPVFSEDALPEIGPKKLSAFALRHGFVERPGPPELPERALQTDRDLVDAPRGDTPPERLHRYLVTAAIDIGPARPRLVMGHGRRMPVLGQRLWSVPRLAALGGAAMVSLLVGAAALWLIATQQRAANTVAARSAPAGASAASTASAAAPRSAASAATPRAAASSAAPPVAASAAAASILRPAPASAASVPTVASAAVPASVPVAAAARPSTPSVAVPRPSAPVPPLAAASPVAATPPPAAAPPPSVPAARPPAASTTPVAAAPASAPMVDAQRASAPLVPRLKPDLAEAARAEREKHPNLPRRERSTAPAASAPPGASSAPGQIRFYALVTRPMRQRAEAEAVLKRLRTETSRIAHPTAIETGLQQTPEGWRVTWWPFTHPRQAENARAALAARGVPLEMIEF